MPLIYPDAMRQRSAANGKRGGLTPLWPIMVINALLLSVPLIFFLGYALDWW